MKYTKLENKIRQHYGNSDHLINLLRKIDLEKSLILAIEKIETAIKSNNKNLLISLSGNILLAVNSKIVSLNNEQDKKHLEYFFADFFQDYINTIIQHPEGQNLLKQINDNLKNTCEFQGYDYTALSNILNLEKHIILLPKPKNDNPIYYTWNGRIEELDEISKDIQDKKWINSVKEFKRLFKPIVGNLQVICNKEHRDELLLLFHILKEKNLIIPKGKGNSGHFAPFIKYSLDNDGKFLFEKAVNKHHESMKRNLLKYNDLKQKTELLVSKNASKTLDNGGTMTKVPKKKN